MQRNTLEHNCARLAVAHLGMLNKGGQEVQFYAAPLRVNSPTFSTTYECSPAEFQGREAIFFHENRDGPPRDVTNSCGLRLRYPPSRIL